MWLSELTVHNCRIIEETSLSFSDTINFIHGGNGSGKSSLLEAISVLSVGRSFRTSRISEVISYQKESILCSSLVQSENFDPKRIGIDKSPSKTVIRVNKVNIKSQAELSRILPISIIHPLSHELITGGSSKRRQFVDWLAFYQFPEFHSLWKRYQLLLKQRNAALKNPKLYYALEHLTVELCQLQQPIHQYRAKAVEQLKETICSILPSFMVKQSPKLSLISGLPVDVNLDVDSLVSYYNKVLSNDKKRGRTLKGIHCADMNIYLDDMPASSSASRGQSKILSLLLHIAQNMSITQQGIIAIDDLAAEIDETNYKQLIHFIPALDRQIFITSTRRPDPSFVSDHHGMFHVKHGNVEY